MYNMKIKEFSYDTLPSYSFICLVSKRRSGKSTAIKDLVYNYFIKEKKYRRIYVFSPTARLTKDYSFIQDEYIYEDFDEEVVNNIIEIQKEDIEKDPKSKQLNTLLILDDVANSMDRKTIDLVGKVSAMGRHIRCSVLFASQNFKKEISPLIRTNLDFLIMWKQSNMDTNKDIMVQWLGASQNNKKEAISIIETVPIKFRCLVIDNTSTDSNLENYVFHYTFKEKSIPKDYKFYR